jgi:branched-chain amino acid transport system permease protein
MGTTLSELRAAGREARAAWSPCAWVQLGAFAAVLLLPAFLPAEVAVDGLARFAYLAVAAVGLGLLVGPGGMPSLCQGVFVGVGALAFAHLREAPLVVSLLVSPLAAGALGAIVGVLVARFRPLYVAVATWLVAWSFALLLVASPWIGGGAQGLVVEPLRLGSLELTPTWHFELAVCLVLASVLGVRALRRSVFGLQLLGPGSAPAACAAIGVPADRARIQAFAVAASMAGLAGALLVDLALVADPTAYGPLLSFELLVACLVGGASSPLGPVVGIAIVGLLGPLGDALGRGTGAESARFGTMLSALLLLVVLAWNTNGIVPALAARLPKRSAPPASRRSVASGRAPGETLEATRLRKRFGEVAAVDGVDLRVEPGRIVALVGPNGSGKSTALRLLSGSVPLDGGSVALGGRCLDDRSTGERVELGVVRMLQRQSEFPGLTALEVSALGASSARPTRAGRALLATPTERAAYACALDEGYAALERVELGALAARHADRLTGVEQRLLALAAALGTRPTILLLDEPSAGAGQRDLQRLERILRELRDDGLGILVVEHNLRLVGRLADTVVVLDRGEMVAVGPPHELATDPRVRAVYLGRRPGELDARRSEAP